MEKITLAVSKFEFKSPLVAKLVPILKSLPVLPNLRESIENEANYLGFATSFIHRYTGSHSVPVGKSAAVNELRRFGDQLALLLHTMGKLHMETSQAFDRAMGLKDGEGLRAFYWKAYPLYEIMLSAEKYLKELPFTPRPNGAPKKEYARQIAWNAATAYQRLTGKRPTVVTSSEGRAGGNFVEYLEQVFKALTLKASAESQARWVCRRLSAKEKRGTHF